MPHPKPLQCFPDSRGLADNHRTWKGLSSEDRTILSDHLENKTFDADPLYFHLPCGSLPTTFAELEQRIGVNNQAQIYYKRADLICQHAGVWHICEIKPSAGYVAFGQALLYHFHLSEAHHELRSARPAILTDAADPDLRPLLAAYGVTLFELPDATFEPLGRPT